MRVAHSAVVTPGRCGLYETARELVAALRALDVDSRIVDPKRATNKLHPGGSEDRGAVFCTDEWALDADVVVSHSGLHESLEAAGQPLIHVAHGRPRSSFLQEKSGGAKVYSHLYTRDREERCKAVVTFWPEHVPFLEVMFTDTPVQVVQAPVDLVAWAPEHPERYDFRGKGGAINIVCADMWRADVDPFEALNAVALFARALPAAGVKLHLYGVSDRKGPVALLRVLQDDGTLGEVRGHAQGLAHVYRAATCAVTTHAIDTRSVREAMACGCPVARIDGSILNGYVEAIWSGISRPRHTVRAEAVSRFDPTVTAHQFLRVLESVA